MNFSFNFNQDINTDIYSPIHYDNYYNISSTFNINLNEQKNDDNNTFNDYYIFSKFLPPDESLTNYNEKLNLEKKDNKIINNYDAKNKTIDVNQSMNIDKLEIKKSHKNFKNKGKIAVKRKRNNYNIHDKYANDNIIRKIKNLVLNSTLKFLNIKIKDIYRGNIGNGIIKKELVPLNQSVKYNTSIEYNKQFINKTLKEIFASKISSRYKSYYLPNRNDLIINRLLNDKDKNKALFFKRLFNIKFIQCIQAFSGVDICEELKGFAQFEDIKKDFNEEPQYIDKLQYYLSNFELIINERKGRKNKTKTKNEKKE